MKFNKDWTKKRWVGYTIAACSAVVLYFLLSHLHIIGRGIAGILGILAPIILGLVIAYILDPFAKFFELRVFGRLKSERTRRNLGVLCGLALVFGLIALLLVALIPQLISSARVLIGNLQSYMDAIRRFADYLSSKQGALNFTGFADK